MRSRRNLEIWTRTHRLTKTFPNLSSSQKQGIYQRDEGQEIASILDAIQGSPRTMIIFPPGQGASTVLNKAVSTVKDSKVRVPHIFIVFDPTTFPEEDLGEAFLKEIRIGVFKDLIMSHWEYTLYGNRRQMLFEILNVDDEIKLDEVRIKLETHQSSGDIDKCNEIIEEMSSEYEDEECSLLAKMHKTLGISTFLVFDFPHTASDDLISSMVREIKWFDENAKDADFPPAALSEAYFITSRQADFMYNVWQRDYRRFVVPPYSELEVFAIMSSQFTPRVAGREVPLSAVFSQDFVKRVWKEGKPLQTMMEDIKNLMLEALDVPQGNVPFMLAPKPQES